MTRPLDGVLDNWAEFEVSGFAGSDPAIDIGSPPRRGGLVAVAVVLRMVLGMVAVAATACVPAAPKPSTIAVGDSITHGVFAIEGYGRYLALPNVELVGGPGQAPTFEPWATSLAAAVAKHHPKTVIIQACCNHYDLTTSAQWRAALRRVGDAAGSARVIAVTTPLPAPNSPQAAGTWMVNGANAQLRTVASERGWTVVDLAAMWPPGTPGIHFADGLHLSSEGAKAAGAAITHAAR